MNKEQAEVMCRVFDKCVHDLLSLRRVISALNDKYPQYEWFWTSDIGFNFRLREDGEL